MFRVPSSTPPSTPDSRRASRQPPSTTPAGLPPDRSFIPSSTPAGPPPSGLFGGPRFAAPNFHAPNPGSSPPKYEFTGTGSGDYGVSTSGRPGSQRGRAFHVPSSSPLQDGEDEDSYADDDDDDDEMENDDAEGEEDEDAEGGYDEDEDEFEEDEDDEEAAAPSRARAPNRFSQSVASQQGNVLQQFTSPPIVMASARQSQYDLANLAKGLAPNVDHPILREPDNMVVETERLLEKLHESMMSDLPEKRGDALREISHELLESWQTSAQWSQRVSMSASTAARSASSSLFNANRLAGLLLKIHYPPLIAQRSHPRLALAPLNRDSRQFTPIPKVLIDWLNTYHGPVSEVGAVLRQNHSFSSNPGFWDAIHVSAFRGNFAATLKLLKGASFDKADSASIDNQTGQPGYRGPQLEHTNNAVGAAIALLQECPAVSSDDWDIKGQDWALFRRRVAEAQQELQEYSEGESRSRYGASQSFQASNFGISQSQNSFNLSLASRKAESKVPWTIYENLNKLYQQLLGSEIEILGLAGDWVEGVLGLTIWWNGDEQEGAQGSLAASRRSVARSQRVRPVDVTPVQAYCQRMSCALAAVLANDEECFSIRTSDPSEVGLACIFDDNIGAVLQILRSWSLCIASAVAEIASGGDWFRQAGSVFDHFDQSDLMLLSYNEQPRTAVTKDDLLIAYADTLSTKDKIIGDDGRQVKEGWELAIPVLGRLSDARAANRRIEEILSRLPLQSAERVDKISRLCYALGLSEHAQNLAMKYADYLRNQTENYGDTLFYYARAHDAEKIQEVLRVLVAHCLVKSIAYPPLEELDESLYSLITSPKQTLTDLARVDPEGARLLSNYLSGYATIRKFYDLRDEEILAQPGEKPAHQPMARKRAAASALMVIIASATSSIQGGLYDPEVETVVQVDVLLALLGEALVFVNQPKRTLTLQHLFSLLSAVEDIDTAPSMIRAQCEECLATTLAAAHEGAVPSPRSLLQKSTSNLTAASSQYSLIGSTEFGSTVGQSTDSSTVLVKGGHVDDAKRAWDWRKGFKKDTTGAEIIRLLRLALARETATAFAGGDV